MKKIISVIMCCCIMFTSLAMSGLNAVAETDTVWCGIFQCEFYKDNTATIYDIDYKIKGTVVIPSTLVYKNKTYTVEELSIVEDEDGTDWEGDRTAREHPQISEIVFPDTVTKIYMAKKCVLNLKKFNIPKNVKDFYTTLDLRKVKYDFDKDNKYYFLKNNALYYKSKPTIMYRPMDIDENYVVAEGTTKVKGFVDIDHLKKLTFPSSVEICTPIKYCDNLEVVDMSKAKMTKVCWRAFSNNDKLRKVIFPKTLKSEEIPRFVIDNDWRNQKVTSVTLPSNIELIDVDAFEYCPLKSIKLPDSLKRISRGAFTLTTLKKVTFPKKLEVIGVGAFSGCVNLKEITIKNGNCKIGSGVFDYCKKLNKVTITDTKNVPKFAKNSFKNTKSGIKFYVKNKNVAKKLKKNLKGSGVKKAKIYIKTKKSCKLAYSGVK